MRALALAGALLVAATTGGVVCVLGYQARAPSMMAAGGVQGQEQRQRQQRQLTSSRRDALLQGGFGAVVLGLAVGGGLSVKPAQAFPFGGGDEVASGLDEVAKARAKVEEVVSQLKEKKLKGGRDDSAVVVRYTDAIYKPMQEKVAALAPQIKLPVEGEGAEEKQKRLETLPFLLKGHLLELAAACRSGDAKEQLQEMEEVAESVDEFLALASAKYAIKSYLGGPAEFDIKREYGPFACEYWGKVRLPDSNICKYPNEL